MDPADLRCADRPHGGAGHIGDRPLCPSRILKPYGDIAGGENVGFAVVVEVDHSDRRDLLGLADLLFPKMRRIVRCQTRQNGSNEENDKLFHGLDWPRLTGLP